MKKTLWTKNYTCIMLATLLSVIGGEAMVLPVSLLVFEKTQSTLLSALIMVCGILPDMVFSVLMAPLIDKGGKKRWIVGMDLALVLVYLFVGMWIRFADFQYGLYVIMTLVIGTISVFYRLAYHAWYPELIPVGFEQKGYAVSGTIYPLITIIMSPIATFLYETMSMSDIFFLVSGITVLGIVVEMQITEQIAEEAAVKESYTFAQYKEDVKEGFEYLKKEKGIRNIYTYMAVTNGTSEGSALAIQAFYQSQPGMTVMMLGFLKSSEMIGRVISGIVQYRTEVPPKKRFGVTKFVYTFYQLSDMVLLFLPYPMMLVNRFVCGGLGTMSATLRETAVQSYLPENIRARVNAVFQLFFAIGSVLFQFVSGILGEFLPYRALVVFEASVSMLVMWIFIVRPGNENRKVYEAVREQGNA